MLALIVDVTVHAESVEAFAAATRANALASRSEEPGCLRFEVWQDPEHAERFSLFEVYRDEQALAGHRETAHYNVWRTAVEPMMAAPRTRRLLAPVLTDL